MFDYLSATMAKESKGFRNHFVHCHGASDPSLGLNQPQSESDVLTHVINSVDQARLKYTALYVSDPYNFVQYPSSRLIERFLAQFILKFHMPWSMPDQNFSCGRTFYWPYLADIKTLLHDGHLHSYKIRAPQDS